jgi:hypothetical protein
MHAVPRTKTYSYPCLAPGCETIVTLAWDDRHLCKACYQRVKDAMAGARDSLMALMPAAHDEVARWLNTPWVPPSRYAIIDEEFSVLDPKDVAREMADDLADEHRATGLAFKLDRPPMFKGESERAPWRFADGPALSAWRDHLASHLAPALRTALETFDGGHVGDEIKAALLGGQGYTRHDTYEALDDTDALSGLSPDALMYIDIRFAPTSIYLDHDNGERVKPHWWQYPVLPAEIMAILDAVQAHVTGRERAEEARAAQQRETDDT